MEKQLYVKDDFIYSKMSYLRGTLVPNVLHKQTTSSLIV